MSSDRRQQYDQVVLKSDANSTFGSNTKLAATSAADGFSVDVSMLREGSSYLTTTHTVQPLPDGMLRVVTDPAGFQTAVNSTYDAALDVQRTITTTTDDHGVVNGAVKVVENSPDQTTTTVSFASARKRTLKTSVVKTVEPAGATDPALITKVTLTTTEQPSGRVSVDIYDYVAKRTTHTSPEGRVSTLEYDDQWRLMRSTEPLGVATTYTYDGNGRPYQLIIGSRRLESSYNARAELSAVSAIGVDSSGTTVSETTRYPSYDDARRLKEIQSPSGAKFAIAYNEDGAIKSFTTPGGFVHSFEFLADRKLGSYTPPPATHGGTAAQPVAFHRYADGATDATVLPFNDVLKTTYDPSGRPAGYSFTDKTSTYRPDGLTETIAYDSSGQIAATTAVNGPDVTYAYEDGFLARTTYAGSGNLAAITGSVASGFDDSLQINKITITAGGVTESYSVAFDGDGLLTQVGGLMLRRDGASGRVTSSTLDKTVTTPSVDAYGDIEALATQVGGSNLYELVVNEHDPFGRQAAVGETLAGTHHDWTYTYDADGHLSEVTKDGAPEAHYEYDANGRIKSGYRGGVANPLPSIKYDDQDRIIQFGSAQYGYTEAGERASKTDTGIVTSYTYNPLGALIAVADPTRTIEYVLDGEGRRVGRMLDGKLEVAYLYSGSRVFAAINVSSKEVSQFVYGDNSLTPAYMRRAGRNYRILSDLRGSVRAVVAADTGAVMQKMEYDAFGLVLSDVATAGFDRIPMGFAGGLYDRDTGLVHFGAREYDAVTTRWMSRDSALIDGGADMYAYAQNDPIDYVDLDGREPEPITAVGYIFKLGEGGNSGAPRFVAYGPTLTLEEAAAHLAQGGSTLATHQSDAKRIAGMAFGRGFYQEPRPHDKVNGIIEPNVYYHYHPFKSGPGGEKIKADGVHSAYITEGRVPANLKELVRDANRTAARNVAPGLTPRTPPKLPLFVKIVRYGSRALQALALFQSASDAADKFESGHYGDGASGVAGFFINTCSNYFGLIWGEDGTEYSERGGQAP